MSIVEFPESGLRSHNRTDARRMANAACAVALANVAAAFRQLNELGIEVQRAEIGANPRRNPRIQVSPPGPWVQLARGAIRITADTITWAASVAGCQVEWVTPK